VGLFKRKPEPGSVSENMPQQAKTVLETGGQIPVWAVYGPDSTGERTEPGSWFLTPEGARVWRSWPEPDFSTLPFVLKKTRSIGAGTANIVYLVEHQPENEGETSAPAENIERSVLKVELLGYERDNASGEDAVFSPWTLLGFGEQRSHFSGPEIAEERKKLHLAIRQKVVDAGIEAVDLKDSFIFSTKPIERPGKEALRLPLYAELWEHPGNGNSMGADEEALERMYASPEGREQLRHFADTLLEWGKEGFVFDVVGRRPFDYAVIVPMTEEKLLPYPKNFYLTEDQRMVALDFNMGMDVTQDEWWQKIPLGALERENLLYRASSGTLYLRPEFNSSVRGMIRHMEEQMDGEDPRIQEKIRLLRTRSEFFLEQLGLGALMLQRVEEYEKSDDVQVSEELILNSPADQ